MDPRDSIRAVTADRGDAGHRLDLVLMRHVVSSTSASRTRLQRWIRTGRIAVNGSSAVRASSRIAAGDVLTIAIPADAIRRPVGAESGTVEVLYEDPYLLVVNKAPGTVAHPTYKNPGGTLLNALLGYARAWADGARPTLVGRLDRFTSGAMVVAKTPRVHADLQRAMRSARKEYLAVVYGRVSGRGLIDLPLARDPGDRRLVVVTTRGSASITRFETLARVPAREAGLALLRCHLSTGRMHQIRVHLAARGWPVVADDAYGAPRWQSIADPALGVALRAFPRHALHARRIAFEHPATGAHLEIDAPIPPDITSLLDSTGLSDQRRPTSNW